MRCECGGLKIRVRRDQDELLQCRECEKWTAIDYKAKYNKLRIALSQVYNVVLLDPELNDMVAEALERNHGGYTPFSD